MISHTFHMPNVLERVDPMVVSLRAHVESELAQDALTRFEICASEALTNLAKHGGCPGAEVIIHVTTTAARVRLEIADPKGAEPFDLKQHARDLTQVDLMAESGRGLGLVLHCADAVDYSPTDTGYRLALDFRKPAQNDKVFDL